MDQWVVGADLGGTKIEVDLVDPMNRIVGRRRIPTNAWEGPRRVVERIARCVDELATALPVGRHVAALGICSPGPVDHETGTLTDPPNLAGLQNSPFPPNCGRRRGALDALQDPHPGQRAPDRY